MPVATVGPVPISNHPLGMIWRLDSLSDLGGAAPQVLGAPRVVDDSGGRAIEFDGWQDGLVAPFLPLVGATSFTVEMAFCPLPGGQREQRPLHLQESGSENRLLIETRVADAEHWFVDTFMRSGAASQTLYAESCLHLFGPWYHVALVYDNGVMRHYVNTALELSGPLEFAPLSAGQTCVGVRLNRVSWFRGRIRTIRFTPRALLPAAFSL